MKTTARMCGIVLAAGASSRMGREKALLPWPAAEGATGTLLEAAVRALRPFAAEVIVVAGRNAEKLAPEVSACGAVMMVNPEPERGQLSSLQTGLREAMARGWSAAAITPVDCPPLSTESLRKLQAAFEETLAVGRWAVAPENNGRHGHPLLAGRALVEALLAEPVTSSARAVLRAHAERIAYVPVNDALTGFDMNTPEQYAELRDAGAR